MTTALLVAFLVSIAGAIGLGFYGLIHFFKELVRDKEWAMLAFIVCVLVFIVSDIALRYLGVLPESQP